jgi:hypothetical protein
MPLTCRFVTPALYRRSAVLSNAAEAGFVVRNGPLLQKHYNLVIFKLDSFFSPGNLKH